MRSLQDSYLYTSVRDTFWGASSGQGDARKSVKWIDVRLQQPPHDRFS